MHIAFLEMVIDPVCTLAFEAEKEEDNIMRRPPRPPKEPLFSKGLISWSSIHGMVAFIAVATIYLVAESWGVGEEVTRALTFVSLVAVIVSLILVDRSYSASLITAIVRPNRALAIVLGIVVAVLSLVLFIPNMRELFRFGPLNTIQLATAFGTGIAVLLSLELLKPQWQAVRA
jgi:Ca2+-transporting ATPase